jgi:hypothetical protein
MKLPETGEEFSAGLRMGLERLLERTKTDKALRQALLNDPLTVLEESGIPTYPEMKIRFFEPEGDTAVIPLPRYEGKD